MTFIRLALPALLLLACNQAVAPALPQTASAEGWCFSGEPIHTADDTNPTVEAVAVIGDEIVHTGPAEGDWCPEGATPNDLNGYTLYPGLTDAHAHLIGIGQREMEVDLSNVISVTELQDVVQQAVRQTPAGETIYGRGWIETH